jgi:hypothetical protein
MLQVPPILGHPGDKIMPFWKCLLIALAGGALALTFHI